MLVLAGLAGLAGIAVGRRSVPQADPRADLELRIQGWLACEAVVERELPELAFLVRTSVPASMRLAYEEREERIRRERFLSAEWRRPRSRGRRLIEALSRRVPF